MCNLQQVFNSYQYLCFQWLTPPCHEQAPLPVAKLSDPSLHTAPVRFPLQLVINIITINAPSRILFADVFSFPKIHSSEFDD